MDGKKIWYRCIAISVWVLLRVVRCIPLSLCRPLGRCLGRLGYYLQRRPRDRAMKNLDLAYGDSLSQAEKRRIVRGCFESVATVGLELPHIGKLRGSGWKKLVDVIGVDRVDTSRGAIVTVCHLGNWEWMSAPLVAQGYPAATIANTYPDKFLERTINDARSRGGVLPYGKDGGVQETIRLLRQGYFIGIISDQSPRRGGVPVTMFGQPCWATPGPALASLRTGLPLHHAAMWRGPRGHYTLEIFPKINFEPTGDLRSDLLALTQLVQDQIEAAVRAHPEQYLWFHDRWKHRPACEAAWNRRAPAPAAK